MRVRRLLLQTEIGGPGQLGRVPPRRVGQPQACMTSGQRVDSWCLRCPFLALLRTNWSSQPWLDPAQGEVSLCIGSGAASLYPLAVPPYWASDS